MQIHTKHIWNATKFFIHASGENLHSFIINSYELKVRKSWLEITDVYYKNEPQNLGPVKHLDFMNQWH